MPWRFTVLASGSAGNASLLEADGFGLLLDAGLGPRQLAARLARIGASWQSVHAVLLTHTHTDHWRERTLAYLHRHEIPLYCHADHHGELEAWAPAFGELRTDQLVRLYEENVELHLAPGVRCRPLALRHDSPATFGFRFDGAADIFGHSWSLGYVADLGCWDHDLVEALADVDVLALEFNHDVPLQHASGRHPRLIARILGDDGHLSNVQAAGLVEAVLRRSAPERLLHLIQLHLSRDCNRPALARQAAFGVLNGDAQRIQVHTATQDAPGPSLCFGDYCVEVRKQRQRRPGGATGKQAAGFSQAWLPGLEA